MEKSTLPAWDLEYSKEVAIGSLDAEFGPLLHPKVRSGSICMQNGGSLFQFLWDNRKPIVSSKANIIESFDRDAKYELNILSQEWII